MKIVDVKAYPTSYRVPKELQVSLGIGTMTKRDCVIVKVTTEDGIVGWGESHHARSPGSIGHLINTTLTAANPAISAIALKVCDRSRIESVAISARMTFSANTVVTICPLMWYSGRTRRARSSVSGSALR